MVFINYKLEGDSEQEFRRRTFKDREAYEVWRANNPEAKIIFYVGDTGVQ